MGRFEGDIETFEIDTEFAQGLIKYGKLTVLEMAVPAPAEEPPHVEDPTSGASSLESEVGLTPQEAFEGTLQNSDEPDTLTEALAAAGLELEPAPKPKPKPRARPVRSE
jgi:hypothetical protein